MKFFTGLLFALAFAAVLPGAAIDGQVTASRVNARLRPELKAPVAFALNKGDKVKVTRQIGNWVEFEAPVNTPVFISAVHIRNNKTTIELNMRIKGEPNAPVLGMLPAGTEVKVEKITRYGWAKIQVPATVKLYAAKFYVAYDVEALKATPAPIATPTDDKIVAPVAKDDKVEAKKAPATAVEVNAAPVKSQVAPQPIKDDVVKPVAKAEAPKEVQTAKPVVVNEVKPVAKPVAAVAAKPIASQTAAAEKIAAHKKELTVELENLFAKMDSKRAVKLTGIVVKVPKSNSICTMFALLGNNKNLGFLAPVDPQTVLPLEKKVTIEGEAYKIGNWKAPIVLVNSVKVEQ